MLNLVEYDGHLGRNTKFLREFWDYEGLLMDVSFEDTTINLRKEFITAFLLDIDAVVKYDPYYMWDSTNYYGASIKAFYHLGRSKGYSLVYAEKEGVNLFFVRDDLIEQHGLVFKHINQYEKLYQAPKYGKGPNGGHTADPLNRTYIPSETLLK